MSALFPPGTIAAVTGGSRGIGRAVALELARESAFVIIGYQRDAKAAAVTVAEIVASGGAAVARQVDIAEEDSVRAFFQAIRTDYRQLDVLVSNAGTTRDGLLMTMPLNAWDAVIRTNLTGTFLCNREALRIMASQRFGAIVNLSSASIHRPGPGQVNYCAAKAGIVSLTRTGAIEAARFGVRVNVVEPGYVSTDMTRALAGSMKDAITRRVPLGRIADANEIAPLVAFLASSRASYITGAEFVCDGGAVVNVAPAERDQRANRRRPNTAHEPYPPEPSVEPLLTSH